MRKNHRRDPIDDSLLYFLLFLHLEKNPSQSVFLSFFISPPPNCLYLIRPQKLFSSQLRTTSSLRSFRSISVPPIVGLSRSSSSSRGLCRLHDPTVHARATMARFTATNDSIQILACLSSRRGGHLFHARSKPDRFARGSRFFLDRVSSSFYCCSSFLRKG